jgi:hypothetical protein
MATMAENDDLKSEIAGLRAELERLNGNRYVRIHNSIPRLLAFQFVRGLALGLGTVIGASVLVSILAYFLAQIDFLPIIGDWAAQIADQIGAEIEATRSEGDTGD